MKIIKNWVKAFLICKKHNIKWNPFHNLKGAECVYSFDDRSMTVNINPFYQEFMTSFMHEVGHLKRWDRLYKKCIAFKRAYREVALDPVSNFKMKTDCILTEEFQAWKYSKRFLKNEFNGERARKYFKTYFPRASKELGVMQACDKYSAFDGRI